jgi:choline-glycine betaine transporter
MQFDLFTWWMISISFSIVFLTIVSVYLYANRTCERTHEATNEKAKSVLTNFVFVWVLIGLLIFYIIAVKLASPLIFATGNIVVEVILITYLFRHKTKSSEETTPKQ